MTCRPCIFMLPPARHMLDGRGRIRITDFGQAGLACKAEGRAGKPASMAPEQLSGAEVKNEKRHLSVETCYRSSPHGRSQPVIFSCSNSVTRYVQATVENLMGRPDVSLKTLRDPDAHRRWWIGPEKNRGRSH